jgi:hypothetical protein
VRSAAVGAELWRREAAPHGEWPAAPALRGPEDALDLASVGLAGVPLAALYEGTGLLLAEG